MKNLTDFTQSVSNMPQSRTPSRMTHTPPPPPTLCVSV